MYIDWKNGDINKEQYQKFKIEYTNKSQKLQTEIQALEAQKKDISKKIKSNNQYIQKFLKYKDFKILNRQVIMDLIECIYIHKSGEISVKFQSKDQHDRIVEYIKNNKNLVS